MADDTHDIDGLLRKNAELLSEVKALKSKVSDLEGERDAATEARDAAETTMRQTLIDEPVERELASVFVLPWRHMKPLLAEHFDFDLGQDGMPVAKPVAGGDPLDFEKLWVAVQQIPELAAAVKPGRGGGARASDPSTRGTEVEKPREKVASPFGLR